MEQVEVIKVMKDALTTVMVVSAPMLLIGMIVGVVISVFQATTQINEQTLAFVPKIIAIMLALIIFGGWMLQYLTEFIHRMFSYISPIL